MASFKPSSACCSTPIYLPSDYKPKGTFEEVDGTKCYVSRPSQPTTKALFILYDIFGYSPQILEGADALAQHYNVVMPDFWQGQPAPLEWMPMDSGPIREDKMDDFCNGPGETQKTLKRIDELMKAMKSKWPESERWGLVGYCWGGWIVPFATGADTYFKVGVQLHPGFPDPGIASKVSVPLLALCSKDEPEGEYSHFKPALRVEHRFEHFPEMAHGWLSARADLSKEEVRRDFQRGYAMVIDWCQKHL